MAVKCFANTNTRCSEESSCYKDITICLLSEKRFICPVTITGLIITNVVNEMEKNYGAK